MIDDIKKLIKIIENIENDITLWHGTSESVETIKKTGLIASRHGAVFLTDNPNLAIEYAETDQERTGTDNITIVSVKVSDLDQSKLIGDIDHTLEDDWKTSLKETDQCMYVDNIPPNILKIKSYN
jgi:hypothetical protein